MSAHAAVTPDRASGAPRDDGHSVRGVVLDVAGLPCSQPLPIT